MPLRAQLQHDEFDAFISYSRKDQEFARRLERALEGFRAPGGLDVPQRPLRIFRDEGDLTGVEYYASIDRSIAQCTKLIIVCSPNARKSEYVNDEIRRFAKARGKENILPILLEGLPNNEAGLKEDDRKAFPEALCEALGMPLATSYRGFAARGGRVDQGAFESSWYTLLANLYDVSREAIEERDRKRRRKRKILTSSIVGGVMAALATLAGVAWQQAREAERQRAEAEQQRTEAERQGTEAERQRKEAVRQRDILQARQLASQAQALLETGIGDMQSRGVLLAVESMKRFPSVQAMDALQRAVRMRPPLLWEVKENVEQVAFSPDESRVVVASDPTKVLDVATGKVVPPSIGGLSWKVAWDPTGKLIAGSTREGVLLWSAETGEVTRALPTKYVTAMAFSEDGRRLATFDRVISVWSVAEGRLLASLSRPSSASYPEGTSLSFHPDGDLLAAVISVGDPDNRDGFRVDVWSVERSRIAKVLPLDGPASWATFSPDGKLLGVGVRGTVRLMEVGSWQERSRLGKNESRDMVSVGFDRSGRLVAAVGWDAPAQVWRVEDGGEVARLEHERGAEGPGRVSAVTLGPGGRYDATVGDELRMWALGPLIEKGAAARGSKVRSGRHANEGLTGLEGRGSATSEVARLLRWEGAQATVVDTDSRRALVTLDLPEPIVRGQLSADGRLAALVSKVGSARVFEAATGRELEALRHGSGVAMIGLSGAASLAAIVGSKGTLAVRATGDGRSVDHLRVAENVRWAYFSPSGRWLMVSGDLVELSVMEVATGRVVGRFSHDRPFSTLLFTRDERYLATASSDDGTARIWDLEGNNNLLRWHIETNLAGVELAFSDDERVFEFTGIGYDERRASLSALWRPSDLIEAACRTVNRALTSAEWAQYFPASEPYRSTCTPPAEGAARATAGGD